MTSHPATGTTRTPGAVGGRQRPLSPPNHAGLALSTLLGLGDVAGLFSLQQAFDSSQPGPPLEVLVFCAVMGLLTVVACALAWAGRWRTPALRVAAVTRILSAITSLPAFFVPDVPAGLVALAGGGVLVTVVAVVSAAPTACLTPEALGADRALPPVPWSPAVDPLVLGPLVGLASAVPPTITHLRAPSGAGGEPQSRWGC